MGAALRQEEYVVEEDGWRGPHDPPGSFFRPEQTQLLYSYMPKPLLKRLSPAESTDKVSLSSVRPVESQALPSTIHLVSPKVKSEEYDPQVVAVMVIKGIEWLQKAENRRGYSDDELRAYFAQIAKGGKQLEKSLSSISMLDRLAQMILGVDKQ